MIEKKFCQVDVFTTIPFEGNPVAVVFNADGMTEKSMQRIAAWANLSETTFVHNSNKADYRLRIFTPKMELPFAGHPTIGSAYAVREAGLIPEEKKTFIQECGAGLIPITVEDDECLMARTPRPRILKAEKGDEQIAAAFGKTPVVDPMLIDVGPVWAVVRLEDPARMAGLEIDLGLIKEFSEHRHCVGVNIYAVDGDRNVHVRTFAPAFGINEDPVCGSGNACVAAHIKASGVIGFVGERYSAFQGRELGRNGQLRIVIDDQDIFIGGRAVTAITGKILI